MIGAIVVVVVVLFFTFRHFKRKGRRADATQSLSSVLFGELPAWKGEPWKKGTGSRWL